MNGPSPVPAGGFGSGTFDSPVQVLYDSGDPATGQSWGAKVDEWKLFPDRPGFTILGHPAAGRVYAEMSPLNVVLGKLNEDLAQGSSGGVSIWFGPGGSEFDSTWDITAHDWLMASGGDDLATGLKVVCHWINGNWYITEAECS